MTNNRARVAGLSLSLLLAAGATACSGGSASSHNGRQHTPMPGMSSGMPGMPDMSSGSGNGLAASASGLTLAPLDTTPRAATPVVLRFRITGADGRPVTAFKPDQTKLMHLYLIRSDLTGFQHVHPSMAADGTWTASLAGLRPGAYREYASFTPSGGEPLVLSRPVTVPGAATAEPLPAPAPSTTVDGYTVTVSGHPMAGMEHPLTVSVSKDGKPVHDLQPYLGTDAHLTAFHTSDLGFAHLHPQGAPTGGPDLTFHAMLPAAGDYRLFVQFQTAGRLHTAAVTLSVG